MSVTAGSLRKYIFRNSSNPLSDSDLVVLIRERNRGTSGYSFYTWASAPILAWYLWDNRLHLAEKKVLEIGAGTGLPGIVAAKCGADVLLSDSCALPKTLQNIQDNCNLNGLAHGTDVKVLGLSWGLLLNNIFSLEPVDLIIGSDCFYDPSVFEEIIVTISFLLDRNPSAKFLFTYQERSSDWSFESLLRKWKLKCSVVDLSNIWDKIQEYLGPHTIHLLEITRQ